MANTISVSIVGDASRFNKAADGVTGRLGRLGRGFGGIGKIAAGVFGGALITRGFDALTKGIGDSISEAQESIKVGKLTNAVLKSTGGAANVTASQVGALATAISNKVGIDDEAIQSGENLLLTFTNIRNEVGKGNDIFNRATSTITDMSVALGQDMKSSAIQVGKALNDPIKGVTALQRVGVSFTQKQKDQIKTLVESGKTLDAQKLILKELNKEFGGAAEAAATPLDKLKVSVGNLEESFGNLLLPILDKAAKFATNVFIPAIEAIQFTFRGAFSGDSIQNVHGWLKVVAQVGAALRGIVDFIKGDIASAGVQFGKVLGLSEDDPRVGKIIKTLARIREVIGKVIGFIARNWKPILLAAGAVLIAITSPILGVIAALVALYVKFQVVRDVVDAVVKFVGDAVAGLVAWVRENLDDFQEAFEHVVNVVQALWSEFGDEIVSVVKAVFNSVMKTIEGALDIIRGIIQTVVALINGDWGKAWDGIKQIFEGVWKIIVASVGLFLTQIKALFTAALGALARIVGDHLGQIVSFFLGLPKRIILALAGLEALLIEKGIALIRGFLVGIINKAQELYGYIASIPGKVIGFLGDASRWLYDIGKKILGGLIDGAKDKLGDVKDFFGGIAGKITSWKGPLDYDKKILQPAGVAIMSGLVVGVRSKLPDLRKAMRDVTLTIRQSMKPGILQDVLATLGIGPNSRRGILVGKQIGAFGSRASLGVDLGKALGFAEDSPQTKQLMGIASRLHLKGANLTDVAKFLTYIYKGDWTNFIKVQGALRTRRSAGSLAVGIGTSLGYQEDDPIIRKIMAAILPHVNRPLVNNLYALDTDDAMRKLRDQERRREYLYGWG